MLAQPCRGRDMSASQGPTRNDRYAVPLASPFDAAQVAIGDYSGAPF